MSLRLTLNSKHLILLFSACFLVSAYFNTALWGQRKELISTQETAREELVREQQLLDSIRTTIAPAALQQAADTPVRSLDEELVSFLITAKSDLPARLITLSTFNVSRGGATKRGNSVATMSTPFQRAQGLKTTSIKLAGKYRNLSSLRAYIAALKKHPVILSGVTIEQENFTLLLHLIGK